MGKAKKVTEADDGSDELQEFIAEQQEADPAFRGAFEDAEARSRLIRALSASRRMLGKTQAAIADVMATTQSAVSELERSGADARLSTLQRYARAVGKQIVVELMPAGRYLVMPVRFDVRGAAPTARVGHPADAGSFDQSVSAPPGITLSEEAQAEPALVLAA